jgi:hypothetical protein
MGHSVVSQIVKRPLMKHPALFITVPDEFHRSGQRKDFRATIYYYCYHHLKLVPSRSRPKPIYKGTEQLEQLPAVGI